MNVFEGANSIDEATEESVGRSCKDAKRRKLASTERNDEHIPESRQMVALESTYGPSSMPGAQHGAHGADAKRRKLASTVQIVGRMHARECPDEREPSAELRSPNM